MHEQRPGVVREVSMNEAGAIDRDGRLTPGFRWVQGAAVQVAEEEAQIFPSSGRSTQMEKPGEAERPSSKQTGSELSSTLPFPRQAGRSSVLLRCDF